MKNLTFNKALWILVILAVGYLMAGPLIMNAWASSNWKEIDCQFDSRDKRYFYEFNNGHYVANRLNFWQLGYNNDKTSIGTDPKLYNDKCWISPSDPQMAVYRLDAFTNWSYSIPRLAASIMLLACVWLLNFALTKRLKQAR